MLYLIYNIYCTISLLDKAKFATFAMCSFTDQFCVRSQINGAALRGMSSERLSQISPGSTRVMIKTLLQSIQINVIASQV